MRKTWLQKTLVCLLATVLTTSLWSSSINDSIFANEEQENIVQNAVTEENKVEEEVLNEEITETENTKEIIEETTPPMEDKEPVEKHVVEPTIEETSTPEEKESTQVVEEVVAPTKQEKVTTITITSEEQLIPYFPDANFRKAVFNAVQDGSDHAQGATVVEALANFTGEISAKKKGIADIHGIELLRKATLIDLRNNEINDLSFLGRDANMGNDNFQKWYGYTPAEAIDGITNVEWSLAGNPIEKVPLNFGGRLVIQQAGTSSYTYPENVSNLTTFLRSDSSNGVQSGKISINKTKIMNNGIWENVNIETVNPLSNTTSDYLNIYDFDNAYAYFNGLSKSSSLSKIGVGTDEDLHYWTSDEFGTITPGSQSHKYYITERFQIFDRLIVTDEYDGTVKLTKVDKNNNAIKLTGAQFALYKADGTRFNTTTYTTDAKGIIEVSGLAEGSYYFQETKAPDNYLISSDPYNFTIAKPNDITTTLAGGLTQVTPTGASSPIIAADNERFMVGPNRIDAASPDITLTKGTLAEITKVVLNYVYDKDGTKTSITNEEYTSLDDAVAKINTIKNNNQLLGDVQVSVHHKAAQDTEKVAVQATNEKIPVKDIKVTKVWIDHTGWVGDNPDITIRLFKDKEEIDKVTLHHGELEHTFTNLPVSDQAGNAYAYTVLEDTIYSQGGIVGYVPSIEPSTDGFIITNEWSISDKFNIEGKKEWDDFHDALSLRPETMNIILKRNGKEIAHKTISEQNEWKFKFDNLPIYEGDNNSSRYQYTIEEDFTNENYQALEAIQIDTTGLQHLDTKSITMTNTLKEEANTIEFSGKKVWKDYNNAHQLRPDSIEVELLKDGVATGNQKTVEADAQGVWSYTFTNLTRFHEDGTAYVYTVQENSVPASYKASKDKNNLINTLEPAINETSIEVVKTWVDFNNALETRPETIEVTLLQDGDAFKKATLSATSKTPWKAVFEQLPKYSDDGNIFGYSIIEKVIPTNYTATSKKTDNTFTLTNTLSEDRNKIASISGTKTWNDYNNAYNLRPDSIEVELLQDGNTIGIKQIIKADAQGNWNYTFEELDKFDESGHEYVYTVRENSVPTSYTATVDENNIINTLDPTINETSVEVLKTWVDFNNALEIRPESIEVALLQDGNPFKTTTLSATTQTPWKAVFDQLPKYSDNGTAYVYTIEETEVPTGYKAEVETVDNTITITNTLEPDKNKIVSIKVKKVWEDKGYEHKRPETLTIILKQEDMKLQEIQLNDENNWEATINGLPKFKKDGTAYTYTIEEVEVKGYKQSNKTWKLKKGEEWTGSFTNTYLTPITPEDPKTPDTGDTTQPILLFGLLVISTGVIGTILLKTRKTKKQK